MSTQEIKQVEQELAGLKQDNERLTELRTKYEEDFTVAESAWRKSRAQKDLDAMVKAKSLLDTIKDAQRDQTAEIAKVGTYLNVLTEAERLDSGVEAVVSNQLVRLTQLQQDFGSRLQALQQHVVDELLALDEMRVEWDSLHRQAWGELFGLGLNAGQVAQRLATRDLDVTPLRLRIVPASGIIDNKFETAYSFPLRMTQQDDPRSKAEVSIGQSLGLWLHTRQIQRDEQEYRQQQAERDSQRQHWLSRASGDV